MHDTGRKASNAVGEEILNEDYQSGLCFPAGNVLGCIQLQGPLHVDICDNLKTPLLQLRVSSY